MRFSPFKQRIRTLLLKWDKLCGKIDTGRRESYLKKKRKEKEGRK